jgi:hypothetical protein
MTAMLHMYMMDLDCGTANGTRVMHPRPLPTANRMETLAGGEGFLATWAKYMFKAGSSAPYVNITSK